MRRRHLGGRRAWEELGAGTRPDAPAGLTRGRWLRPVCVTGRGESEGRSEMPKEATGPGPRPAFWFSGFPGAGARALPRGLAGASSFFVHCSGAAGLPLRCPDHILAE